MAIQQVIYRSSAARCLDDAELGRLVTQAQIYNCSQAVTGVLLCDGQHFLQMLEGEQAAVAKLYDHIAQDPRHTGVVPLLNASVITRLFPA